jgi:NAD(P)-dependent dehydrogenase (short-subunit alcohol dehydrogenase family)
MKGLDTKVCAVVGGANGIGRAAALALKLYGAQVYILDHDKRAGFALTNDSDLQGRGLAFQLTDMTSREDVEVARDKIAQEVGRLDALVNVAATNIFLTETKRYEDWEDVFRGSVESYGVIFSTFLPLMIGRSSSVVNIASISARIAQPGYGTYAAAKAAIVAYTRCLARDFAAMGIRANTVSPGTVWTDANARHIGREFGLDREGADAHPAFGGRAVLRRCADPDEIGEAIAFLVSDSASFITGIDLIVDGGATCV